MQGVVEACMALVTDGCGRAGSVLWELLVNTRTGASQGFPRAAAPVGVFSRGTTRISGSLSCGFKPSQFDFRVQNLKHKAL